MLCVGQCKRRHKSWSCQAHRQGQRPWKAKGKVSGKDTGKGTSRGNGTCSGPLHDFLYALEPSVGSDANSEVVYTQRMLRYTEGHLESLISVILLMGLPGAGKSSFVRQLSTSYTVINLESMGYDYMDTIHSVHAESYSQGRFTLLVIDQTNMNSAV